MTEKAAPSAVPSLAPSDALHDKLHELANKPGDSMDSQTDLIIWMHRRAVEALNLYKAALSPLAALTVTCGCMEESNGRKTWAVLLKRHTDDTPMDAHQVYADEIEGRAMYEAAKLRAFLGQGPEPDILAFDTDAPTGVSAIGTKFAKTYCSQCGGEFGPGDSGFSHCENHRGKA